MKYAIEMGSVPVIYIPSFIQLVGRIHRHADSMEII
jgi:hypothetical protein